MLKEKLLKLRNISMVAIPVAMACPVSAFAEETTSDIANVTSNVTTALSGAKGEFLTALGTVVGIGVSFFLAKYVVLQVINYFKKVASK